MSEEQGNRKLERMTCRNVLQAGGGLERSQANHLFAEFSDDDINAVLTLEGEDAKDKACEIAKIERPKPPEEPSLENANEVQASSQEDGQAEGHEDAQAAESPEPAPAAEVTTDGTPAA